MCKILDVMQAKGRFFVECTYEDGDFMNAKSITILDKSNRSHAVRNFLMDRTRQCFNNRPISPWFRIDEDIDRAFLQNGNEVVFEY